MIPRIIHYCWFGKGLMPHSQKKCIEGWKKLMPDYKIMRWDESTFDLEQYPLAKYACEVKKYALASDVCRYNVLAKFGGIYLDTDVELFQRLDQFLDCNFFTGIELYPNFFDENIAEQYLNPDGSSKNLSQDVPHMEVLTSTMGCAPNFEMIVQLRDYYNNAEASPELALHYREWVNNDRLVARHCAQRGFLYKDETQHFGDNMVVYGTGIFGHLLCPNTQYSVSYHHNVASWGDKSTKSCSELMTMKFDKLGLLSVYRKYKKCKKTIKYLLIHP